MCVCVCVYVIKKDALERSIIIIYSRTCVLAHFARARGLRFFAPGRIPRAIRVIFERDGDGNATRLFRQFSYWHDREIRVDIYTR